MPKNAISTGMVDLVLSPRESAKAILRKIDKPQRPVEPVERDIPNAYGLIDAKMDCVLRVLRVKLSIEYTDYLPSVVCEAIEHRANELGLDDLEEYADTLLHTPAESRQLLAEIVRGEPSRFFCDDATYERLAMDVIPTLMSSNSDDQDFRAG